MLEFTFEELLYDVDSLKSINNVRNGDGEGDRLPYPGIIINNDTLYMNTIIDGGKIFYTTDGSEPTYNSLEWISPIKIQTDIIKAKLFLGPKKSLTLTVKK